MFKCLWGVLLLASAGVNPSLQSRPRNYLCVKENVPCDAHGTCTMQYYPMNSTSCADLSFQKEVTSLGHLALGKLRLESYLFVDQIYSQTAFNLSFSNISWHEMRFRFRSNGNIHKNTCREFIRSSNSSLVNLTYDCLWSDERYEGKQYILDYEARSGEQIEAVQLFFTVPVAQSLLTSLSDYPNGLLVYFEIAPSQFGRTTFYIHWAPAPKAREVRCYRVYVYSNETGEETEQSSEDVCECPNDLCSYTAQKWFGHVRFGVQPLYLNGAIGRISKTQYVQLGGETTRPILVSIVTLSVLVPVILYLMLLLRNAVIKRATRSSSPTILLIYSPSTKAHLFMVETLANYLKTHCNMIALMDEIDIPASLHKDPFVWCNEALQSADVVAVVASPYHRQLRSAAALYHTDRLLLRLLRERFSSSGKTRYLVLMPPYTTSSDVPSEATNLRKLNLPRELDDLLQIARYRWSIPKWLLPRPEVEGALLLEGRQDLNDSLAAASTDLVENRSNYLRQVREFEEKNALDMKEVDDRLHTPSSTSTALPRVDPFQQKAERLEMVEALYAESPSNLENFNLLGPKSQTPKPKIMKMASSEETGAVDLDALEL